MDHRDPTTIEPATADHILAVFRDRHRQQCQYDCEAEEDIELGPETTVWEWRIACDLIDARRLGQALNEDFGIKGTAEEWRAVLEPTRERRLGDVCAWIAARATRRRLQPAGFLGATCTAAGAFLAVRTLLREAGADVEDVAPSTPLEEWTRRHADVFLGPISELAPGALPLVRMRDPNQDIASAWFFLAFFVLVAGACTSSPIAIGVGGVLLALHQLGVVCGAFRVRPISVEFGDLTTFRNLSAALAAGASPS